MLSSLSLDTTQKIYDIAYYVLIGSLMVSAMSTALAFWSGNRISIDLTIRLAGTVKTAGEASERAGQANERAAELEKDAAEARAAIASANERAAQAEQQAAEAIKAAEQERLARVKIEQRLADRHLSDAAKNTKLQRFGI